jgi:uncharacterized membrane protein
MEKKLLSVLAFFVLVTLLAVNVSAEIWNETSQPDVNWMKVYVKGEQVFEGRCTLDHSTDLRWNCETQDQFSLPSIEKGEDVDVKVVFEGGTDVDRADIRVWFRASGSTVEDQTGMFDIHPGNTYTRTLYLKMPETVNSTLKVYTMHVEIEADNTLHGVTTADVSFDVQRLSDEISIKSVNIRSACVSACSTVYADIVVKNTGNHDLEDVYVKASIEELGVSGTAYIDLLVPYRTHDESTSAQVTIPIQLPTNIQAGSYTLVIKAYNDNSEETVSQQFTLSGQQSGTVSITAQETNQDVEKGKSVAYVIMVENKGATAQTFTLDATGLDEWASVELNPSSFTLASGESKLVNVYVTANEDAVSAEHLFSVKVKYGSETKSVNLVANVTEGSIANLDLKTILMIVGIVLAVAIIILLIVLLAQKSRTESDKPEESYY